MPRGGRREGAGRPKGTSGIPRRTKAPAPESDVLWLRLPKDRADAVRAEADRRGEAISALIREAIDGWFDGKRDMK